MSTYNKTVWQDGDIITADKMNNIENGIYSYNEDITNIDENLRLDIINGIVAIDPQIESFSPTASDYTARGIKPSDGSNYPSGKAVFNINSVATSYYMLVSNDFIQDDVKKIESKYGSVYFALIVYSKVDSSYLGVIYREYSYRSAAELASDYNRIYPYQEVDMDELRSLFPDYYFRVEITDTTVNGETACVPSDITSWCQYYRTTASAQRQLVKTVNNTFPDASGNIAITVDSAMSSSSTNPVQNSVINAAISSVSSEVSQLKEDIISGYVALPEETETVSPSASDYAAAAITPKSGLVIANKNAYMNVNGTGATYYTLLQNNYVGDTVTSIDTLSSSVMFILFCYSKSDFSYVGAIYKTNAFKTAAQLESNNVLYPYTTADMDTLRTLFPDYYFRIEITDTSANSSTVPSPSSIASWCTYTVSAPAGERRLVKTVNSLSPDSSGNVSLSSLYGKKIVFFGDSITGNYEPPADYPSILAELTGATVYNAGFGGTCMSDNGETKALFSFCRLIDAIVDDDFTDQDNSGFERNYIGSSENYVPTKLAMLKAINWSTIDYVVPFFGTNDWGNGYTIDNDNDPYDDSTYAGAYRYAFERLQTAYPNIRIVPIAPLVRMIQVEGVWYDSNEYDRGTGHYLYEFANKIIDVSETKYQTKACDMYHRCMITKMNWRRYLMDGIHPLSPAGPEWIARLLVAFFNSYV